MSYDAKPIWFYQVSKSSSHIRQAIDKFYRSWLPEHSRSADLQLYHYTTLKGLKGIIGNRSIRLTHTSTLNDPTELKYGKELILSILNNELSNKHEEIIEKLLFALISQIEIFDEIIYQTYVACFCESSSLLSQWRAYGHRGGGYNLGFEFTSDTKFYHTPGHSEEESFVILRKIIYEPDKQKKLITDYVSLIVSYANDAIKYFKNHDGIPKGWASSAALESASILFDLMLSFKNSVFSEENEWRLILTRTHWYKPDQLQFGENEKGLTPYIETHIIERKEDKTVFPLRTIKFGPMLDISSTKSALKLYVRKEAVSENNIKIDANKIHISDAGFSLRV